MATKTTKGGAYSYEDDTYARTKPPVKSVVVTPKGAQRIAKENASDKMDVAERTYSRLKAEASRQKSAQKALARQTDPPYKVDKAPGWSLPVGGRGKK